MRLHLVRHGQTPSNVSGALDTGVPGPGLTDLGFEQAEVVRTELGSGGAGAVYVSTMVRTQLTAAPTAAALGLEVRVRAGLREISAGHLEMRSDAEAVEEYHAFMAACADGRDATLPGGETSAGVIGRFDEVITEIVGTGLAEVVIFSHGGMIRAWSGRRADNLDADHVMAHPLRNTGTVTLESRPGGGWTALTWDATPLDEQAVPTGPAGPTGEAFDADESD